MQEKKYYNKDGKEIKRQKCEVYTRVMGYIRNVSMFNIGKKTEFYSRKYFEIGNIEKNPILQARANAQFVAKRATKTT